MGQERDDLFTELEEAEVECNKSYKADVLKVIITSRELSENMALINKVIVAGEKYSHD